MKTSHVVYYTISSILAMILNCMSVRRLVYVNNRFRICNLEDIVARTVWHISMRSEEPSV